MKYKMNLFAGLEKFVLKQITQRICLRMKKPEKDPLMVEKQRHA